jgi:hypothetical protein
MVVWGPLRALERLGTWKPSGAWEQLGVQEALGAGKSFGPENLWQPGNLWVPNKPRGAKKPPFLPFLKHNLNTLLKVPPGYGQVKAIHHFLITTTSKGTK